jgi:hypothetical protein
MRKKKPKTKGWVDFIFVLIMSAILVMGSIQIGIWLEARKPLAETGAVKRLKQAGQKGIYLISFTPDETRCEDLINGGFFITKRITVPALPPGIMPAPSPRPSPKQPMPEI